MKKDNAWLLCVYVYFFFLLGHLSNTLVLLDLFLKLFIKVI